MSWVDVISLSDLRAVGRAVVRPGARQILVLDTEHGILACPNRCPHEGYPLSEGSIDGACVLTCNWHNWKFDLRNGVTLVGGDALRRFPVQIEGERVLLDLTDPPAAEIARKVMAAIGDALEERDDQRLMRETARLDKAGLDPVDAVREAVRWAHDRMKYGMTHAFAGAVDWLRLYDRPETAPDERLAALGEILAHIAEDARGAERFPFASGSMDWHPAKFLEAVEAEDETAAVRLLRGAVAAGLDADALEPVMVEAALAHYLSFGHAAIYAVKSCALLRRLGAECAQPILLLWVRDLIYGTREDLLPEFRDYARRLAKWGNPPAEILPLEPAILRRCSAKAAMAIVASWAAEHRPAAIFAVLVRASAWNLLHADTAQFERIDGQIAENASWLDLTHELTFAEAGARAVALSPSLWPALLLQQACFIGRNSGFVDAGLDGTEWRVADPADFVERERRHLFDHGRARHIISVHLLKLLTAAPQLAALVPAASETIHAGLNRFLHAPLKERHVLRMARQMRAFVARE